MKDVYAKSLIILDDNKIALGCNNGIVNIYRLSDN